VITGNIKTQIVYILQPNFQNQFKNKLPYNCFAKLKPFYLIYKFHNHTKNAQLNEIILYCPKNWLQLLFN